MIEIDEVGVTAGDVTLLAPVSVVVQRGEVLVVRGRNGSGKSTAAGTGRCPEAVEWGCADRR